MASTAFLCSSGTLTLWRYRDQVRYNSLRPWRRRRHASVCWASVERDPEAVDAAVRLVPDYEHFVEWVRGDTAAGRASLVMFKASWCHACAKVYPHFVELAREYGTAGCIRCYAVQFDENKKLCRSLGVNSLPYFQVYGGPQAGVCLEERGIGPKRLQELDELFARYRFGWKGVTDADEHGSTS
ncbi:hypothetical protein CCYA_CCYA12G3237 [Cyanidiococcus yangmingshanensis]|nr:hypothetical protein CCYA_CCYA12G3237 [Cyanidiococcus yangmingshanensis]